MSHKPGKTHSRFPFKRSELSKNEATLRKSLGGVSDKDWEKKFGVPRRRKFDGDWYTVSSLHPFRTREEATASAKRMSEKYGPYKYRIVSVQPTGFWVYKRLAHIQKVPGQTKPRRY